MPNHVHAVVTPGEGWELDKILHAWKSFTSHEINKVLGRSGTLWQHEGYDHIVRNPRALWRIEQYIAENPAKAGITTKFIFSRLPQGGATVPVAVLGKSNRDDCSTFNELELIRASGSDAADLEEWLRNDFFEQHCDIFQQRPFVWHIWDGRKRDGFHALVNYHTLAADKGKGRRTLESLTHSYLGDWITRQKDGLKRGEEGADERLAAALALKETLEAIINGEPPYDVFVRWKPLAQQVVGWNPDINDGVRMNIRPFMASDITGGKKGAGVLRIKPNIKWDKDRGKEPKRDKAEYPWFYDGSTFTGDRVNDVHLTKEQKEKAKKT
jgi:hypothetical protein